jgi:polyisoprenoid-binding protein YceI
MDPDHSSVGFVVLHKVSRFRAGFAEFDVTLVVGEDGVLSLEGMVRVKSLKVKNAEQAAHLKSPEFFDASRHPGLTFHSTSVTLDSYNRLQVIGALTVRGHTEIVQGAGTLTYVGDDLHDHERVGIDLEAVVDRTRFGLKWNQALPGGGFAVANEVTILVEIELPKAS